MGNYRAATTDNVSRLPKHWLSCYDRGLYGVGFYGVRNGQQTIYWEEKVGPFVVLVQKCWRFWGHDKHAVVFRISDGKIVYHNPFLSTMNPHFSPFTEACIDDALYVPWRKGWSG